MKTAAITLDWIRNSGNKFSEFNISVDALNLINKSETLKAEIRAYASSENTARGNTNINPGVAQYQPAGSNKEGVLQIAADKLSSAESTFNVLAHELGHFSVEEPGAIISNARANAVANVDIVAYQNACNLTEGYAKYNEVIARNELLAANREQALAEGRPLSKYEQDLEDNWAGSSRPTRENFDNQIVKNFTISAGAYGQLLTPEQIANATALALGEGNKANITSSTSETYFEYCKKAAENVLSSGINPPASSPINQELFRTIYDSDGSVSSDSVSFTYDNGLQIISTHDEGDANRVLKIVDFDDASGSTNILAIDSEGREDWREVLFNDGTSHRTDFDQNNSHAWSVVDSYFDSQGRENYRVVILDDGRTAVTDFDQSEDQDWSRIDYLPNENSILMDNNDRSKTYIYESGDKQSVYFHASGLLTGEFTSPDGKISYPAPIEFAWNGDPNDPLNIGIADLGGPVIQHNPLL
ncbi:MAG: hypothetical protein JSS56_05060 [Proteobacteria bacterium]|nr:hypothetical protein [Pseudomonadota bacterium]